MTNGADAGRRDENGADASMADGVRRIARWGVSIGGAALVAGLVASVAGWAEVSQVCLIAGLGVFISLPVVNVVAALVEEIRRREWLFIGAALAVLGILLFNLGRAL